MNEALRTQIVFEGLVGPIGAAILVALALGLTAYQYLGFARQASPRRALALAAFRLGAFAIAIAFLLGPIRLEQRYQKIRPTLAVVVDGSASMRLPADPRTPDERTRAQAASAIVGREALFGTQEGDRLEGGLADEYVLRFFAASDRAAPVTRAGAPAVGAGGRATDLFGAVAQAVRESEAEAVAGVVLVTDGAVNAGPADAAPFQGLGVPVATIASATGAGYRDLRVASLELPDRVFAGSPATIRARVQGRGFPGRSVQVILREEGRVLATKSVRFDGDNTTIDVEFTHTWREIGAQSLSVSVPVLAEEAIPTNNRKDGKLEVARDKIRVLIVSGSPSWNYRFLRQALKGDPSIDLLSFVILRTPFDTVDVPDYQLSLIPFPTHRLFNDELPGFDLVVFDNFPYRLYFPMQYLENVRKFVEQGGAFAMFGGRSSFDLGGYAGTPVEPLLPVSLAAPGADRYDPTPRPVALTDAGRRHPLMQVAASGEQNESVWRDMPALDGVNVLGGPKPESVVLATAPRSGGGSPLIAVGRHGKGRTLAFASDAFWRWNFESVGRGQANRHYLRFVNQMTRWLIDDPLFTPLSVRLDKEVYQPGDEAKVVVRALNDDFSPAPGANVALRLVGPDGASRPVSVRPGDRPGEFVASLKPAEVGLYTVRVEARTGRRGIEAGGEGRGGDGQTDAPGTGQTTREPARPPARAEATFRLAPSSLEFEDAAPGEAYLAEVAKATNGRFFTLAEAQRLSASDLMAAFPQRAEYRVNEERRTPLWQTWIVFVVVTVLLAAEWTLRRRWGLA